MKREEPLWRRYLRFFGPDVAADVDDELAFHLDMRERDLVARGLTPEQARAEARRRFGDVETIRHQLRKGDSRRLRRTRRIEYVEELMQDLRYGLRTLWQHRGFSAAAVVTLALGIGAATAMFTAVDAALLRPLPFREPSRLVSLVSIQVPFAPGGNRSDDNGNTPDLVSVRAMTDLFEQAATYAFGGLNLAGDGEPLRVAVGVVTPNLFTTLGVAPAVGRGFSQEEERPGSARTVILSHGLWQRRFGGDSVLGRRLELSGKTYEIIGVMPRGFGFPQRSDLWIPLTVPTTFESFDAFRGWLPSESIARLRDGVSPEAAAARLRDAWLRLPAEQRRYRNNAEQVPFVPFQAALAGNRQKPLLVLLGATTLLLLIGCANVTNLMLVRASARRREIAMRAVLGASRGRLVRQLLTESLLLSGAGALGGIAIAFAGLGVMRLLLPVEMQSVAPATVDLRVLGFAVLLAGLTGLLFGLWPAFGAARTDVNETMKSGGHASNHRGAGRLRRALVVFELAVALTLLSGAGLMLRSLGALLAVDPGFEPGRVGALEMTFARGTGPGAGAARLRVMSDALDRLAAMPGIEAAGIVNDLPLKGGVSVSVRAEGASEAAETPFARYLQASAGYFQALGIPLISGRLMTPADTDSAPKVMVINQTLARTVWPGQNPLGKRIHGFGPPGGPPEFRTVIGVVGDVRDGGLDNDAPLPQMYFPVYEQYPINVSLVARGTLDTRSLLGSLRRAVAEADPRQAVYNVRTMDEVVAASVAQRRTNTQLITAFSAAALLLAIVGVYGVVAYGVAQRRRELGIRAALGATSSDLARLVAREGLAMAVAGVVLGLAGAYACSRVIASMLYGVTPTDAATFVLAPSLLLVLVVGATLVPARRAARLDPTEVMRAD